MGQDTAAINDFKAQIEEYEHGLRWVLRLGGVDVKELGSEVVDPKGLFEIIISLIAAASDIPQRILIGSERGELASSQDMRAWASVIANRQTNFAEPVILRRFINWCSKAGVLPKPTSGRYKVEWPSLYELTELEEADVMLKTSQAIKEYVTATGAVDVAPPDEYRERVLKWPKAEGMLEVDEEIEEERAAFEEMQGDRAAQGETIQDKEAQADKVPG